MRKINFAFFLIIILGAVIRFYCLGDNHIGFFRDEAALGFNAWSILQTRADEYGQKFPSVFRSFEVFFMPAYVYLSVPFIKVFGLSEFSTRFLSALTGVILIWISFLISRKLFLSERVGLLTAATVAFSPWAIFYSRGAFEGNLALTFFAAGFYFWLNFVANTKTKYFFGSLVFFVLSMYSYQAPRLVVPIFLLISVLTLKKWWGNWLLFLTGIIFILILYLPIVLLIFEPASYHRAIGVSIFSGSQKIPGFSNQITNLQNLYLLPREFASLYLQYFSPLNLFWQGDYNMQREIFKFSTFYVWQLPLLVVGAWFCLKSKFSLNKNFLTWIFLSPLPASLTLDPFHTYRALLFFLPLSILIGFGLDKLLSKAKKFKTSFLWGAVVLTVASVTFYLFNFLVLTPIYRWRDWDFGYRQISETLKTEPKDIHIVVDDPNTESYIHFLFYGIVPISDYQNEALKLIGDKYYSDSSKLRPEKVNRFEFKKVDWPSERGKSKTIFVFPSNRLSPSEFSGDPKLNLEKTIFAPSGEPAFYIIRVI